MLHEVEQKLNIRTKGQIDVRESVCSHQSHQVHKLL